MCTTVYGSQQGTVQQHVVQRSSTGIVIHTAIRRVITHSHYIKILNDISAVFISSAMLFQQPVMLLRPVSSCGLNVSHNAN